MRRRLTYFGWPRFRRKEASTCRLEIQVQMDLFQGSHPQSPSKSHSGAAPRKLEKQESLISKKLGAFFSDILARSSHFGWIPKFLMLWTNKPQSEADEGPSNDMLSITRFHYKKGSNTSSLIYMNVDHNKTHEKVSRIQAKNQTGSRPFFIQSSQFGWNPSTRILMILPGGIRPKAVEPRLIFNLSSFSISFDSALLLERFFWKQLSSRFWLAKTDPLQTS